MKNLKKIVALVIAVAMCMSISIAIFAAPTDTTLKVDNPVDGHTYTAYQLFVGDLANDGNTLSNVKWGANADTTKAISYTVDGEAKTVTPSVGGIVPQDFLEYVAALTSNTQNTANIIGGWVTGTGITVSGTEATVKTGYYVIKDAYNDASADQTTTLSTYICRVVGPTTVAPKAGTTEHKKEVADVNDTTDTALDLTNLKGIDASKWSKSADHDFGDHVPFKLTTTIGSDFAKYSSYYLAVNDTLKDGLLLDPDSIKVYVDGVEAIKGSNDGEFTLTTAAQSFKVEFTKLNGNGNAAAGKDVVVYYTATLDAATAVIGNPGNWNESYAEFSNNPNDDQSGKGKTPKDTAVVFTYKTDVDKVEKDGDSIKVLAGAEFTLTKTFADGTTKTIAVVKYDKDGHVTTKTADGTATSEGDATKFVFKGLDDGTYTLTETVTPNGYNTIDPVTFVVSATHDAVEGSGITSLTVKDPDGNDFSGELEFTATASTGTIETDILNQKGTVLPTTGGIGTTIFYIVGAILVIGGGILLISKRRMHAE